MSVSGPAINQRLMPLMMDHMIATAPAGADTRTWRY
jgi:hypothetical protein